VKRKTKKQKIVLMAVLLAAAVALLATQLGPVFFGSSRAPQKPAAAAKSGEKGKTASAKSALGTHSQRNVSPPSSKAKQDSKGGGKSEPKEALPLDPSRIDLSAAERQVFQYKDQGLRNPFGRTPFERKNQREALSRMNLKLLGIVAAGPRRLAIIEGKAYAEGEDIREGIRVQAIAADSVTLVSGENQVTLRLPSPELKIGSP
jgi:hypothetical protein